MIDVRVIVKEWACHAIFFKKKWRCNAMLFVCNNNYYRYQLNPVQFPFYLQFLNILCLIV